MGGAGSRFRGTGSDGLAGRRSAPGTGGTWALKGAAQHGVARLGSAAAAAVGREVSGGAGKCTAVRACPGGAAGWRIRSVAASLPRSALCGAGSGAGGGLRGTGRDGPGRAGPAGAALSRLPGP